MQNDRKITVDVLTGFLGSGKTTLLRELLACGGFENTAVVVNELGEIGLDHLLLKEQSDQIALMEGGCLCCAVVDSLPETLLDLCRGRAAGDLPPFERIVIETTGLADPGPIAEVVRRSPLLSHFLEMGVIVTVFDTTSGASALENYSEAVQQIVIAVRIVLSKTDLRGPVEQAERERLASANPMAEIVTATQIRDDPALLVAPPPPATGPVERRRGDGTAHHTHGVRAWSCEVPEAVTRAGLAAFAAALDFRFGKDLLRTKGLLLAKWGAVLVQGVGGRFSYTDEKALPPGIAPHLTCILKGHDRAEVEGLLHWLHVPEGTLPPGREEIC